MHSRLLNMLMNNTSCLCVYLLAQECGIYSKQSCFPLAFGVPAALMVVALGKLQQLRSACIYFDMCKTFYDHSMTAVIHWGYSSVCSRVRLRPQHVRHRIPQWQHPAASREMHWSKSTNKIMFSLWNSVTFLEKGRDKMRPLNYSLLYIKRQCNFRVWWTIKMLYANIVMTLLPAVNAKHCREILKET